MLCFIIYSFIILFLSLNKGIAHETCIVVNTFAGVIISKFVTFPGAKSRIKVNIQYTKMVINRK